MVSGGVVEFDVVVCSADTGGLLDVGEVVVSDLPLGGCRRRGGAARPGGVAEPSCGGAFRICSSYGGGR